MWLFNRSKDTQESQKSAKSYVAVFAPDDHKKGVLFEVAPEATLAERIATAFHIKKESLTLVNSSGDQVSLDQKPSVELLFIATKDVPQGPKPKPIIGNLHDFLPFPTKSVYFLAEKYGKIFSLTLPTVDNMIVISDPDLIQELLSKPDVFQKKAAGVNAEFRRYLARGGIFTSNDDEESWGIAHRILLPAFSQTNINRYVPVFSQVANELLKAWEPFGDTPFDMYVWIQKAATEAICRVSFSDTWNLFNSHSSHEVSETLDWVFAESIRRVTQSSTSKFFHPRAEKRYEQKCTFVREELAKIVKKRLAEPKDAKKDRVEDMLDMALKQDPHSDAVLSESDLVDNLLTLFAAGSETTANVVSWALFEISRNPHVELKIYQEAKQVLGTADAQVTVEQAEKLKYTVQVLKEALRLYPSVPIFGKSVVRDTTLGVYKVPKNSRVIVSVMSVHNNPEYYPHPETFDPDRFSPENVSKRHPYSFVPFSHGKRACSGQVFAFVEAKIFLAKIVLKHCVRTAKNSHVKLCEEGTLKPEGLIMTLSPSSGVLPENSVISEEKNLGKSQESSSMNLFAAPSENLPSMVLLVGTITKTTEICAEKFALKAKNLGFQIKEMTSLDSYASDSKWKDSNSIFVIFSSTYNGCPPDNALKFNRWMDDNLKSKRQPLTGVKFAVFGCGSQDYPNYQGFPIKMDKSLAVLGAERLFEIGKAEVRTLEDDLRDWISQFITNLVSRFHLYVKNEENTFSYQITMEKEAKNTVRKYGFDKAVTSVTLVKKEILCQDSDKTVFHLEIQLPESANKYHIGDYLAILPANSPSHVDAALKTFQLNFHQILNLKSNSNSEEFHVTAGDFFTYFVELNRFVSKDALEILANLTADAEKSQKFREWSLDSGKYLTEIVQKKKRVIDMGVTFPLSASVDIWTKMATRFYSISSSPLSSPNTVSLTVGIVSEAIGTSSDTYTGTCSAYLTSLKVNDTLTAYVKQNSSNFNLKDASDNVVLISAGTGFAPFRGFLQERKQWKIQGKILGKCHVFVGFRNKNDHFYQQELLDYEKEGIATIKVAYSRLEAKQYVQDVLFQEKAVVWDLVNKEKATVYVCGSGEMAKGVFHTNLKIFEDCGKKSWEEANEMMKDLVASQRYLQDIWG